MRKLFFLFLLLAGAGKVMQAQVLWNFGTTSVNGTAVGNPTLPANITSTALTAATQVQNSTTSVLFLTTPALAIPSNNPGASGTFCGNAFAKAAPFAAATSTYLQFILTPAANNWVNITAINWGNLSVATGPVNFTLFSSVDNYTTPIGTATTTLSSTTWSLISPTITPVTGAVGTAVTIRIYASGGTGTPSTTAPNWRVDDIKITATAQTSTASVGRIPKYTGATTFTNSIMAENNGKIGVGTVTPTTTLDVNGTTTTQGFIMPTGGGDSKVLTSNANGVGTWQPATNYIGTAPIVISGNIISATDASVTTTGVVNTGAQTFKGDKSVNGLFSIVAGEQANGAIVNRTNASISGTSPVDLFSQTATGTFNFKDVFGNSLLNSNPSDNRIIAPYGIGSTALFLGVPNLTPGNTQLYKISNGTSVIHNQFANGDFIFGDLSTPFFSGTNGLINLRSLKTISAAPITSGITKMVVSDEQGLLSFKNEPAAADLTNYVTTNTTQSIIGSKTFNGAIKSTVTDNGSTATAQFTASLVPGAPSYLGASVIIEGSGGNAGYIANAGMNVSGNAGVGGQIASYLNVNTNPNTVDGTNQSLGLYIDPTAGLAKIITAKQAGQVSGGYPISIAPGNNEGLRVLTNGNVGIGTNTIPNDYKLAVAGAIIATKVKVQLQANWPDYVFNKNYELPSLKSLELFIKKNNHLPDVPSANEVKKEGIDLGNNQAILLKKVEELTLYIIELNKKVEVLGKENEELKKKVNWDK